MPIYPKIIRNSVYLYWKIDGKELSLGKKDEILSMYKILRQKSTNQKIVLNMLKILERENLYNFFNRGFGDIKQELVNIA